VEPDAFAAYARHDQTRRTHLAELTTQLNLCAFDRPAPAGSRVEFIVENPGGVGVRLRRVRKFKEPSAAGLSTGGVALVADLARFGAVRDREHWREVAFNLKQEMGSAAGFAPRDRSGFRDGKGRDEVLEWAAPSLSSQCEPLPFVSQMLPQGTKSADRMCGPTS
jgi:hypothetical protein